MTPTPETPVENVWVPFDKSLPNISDYVRKIMQRRSFMYELASAKRHLEHRDTVFGQLWNIVSPLFMAGVYYLLIFVLQGGHKGPEFFVHLLAGVFFFNFISDSARRCATSITTSGRLIKNAAFPRAILPLTEAYTSLIDTLPSVAVLMIFRIALVHQFGWQLLQSLLALAIGFVFSIGLGLLLACANVYFRDTTAVLPYVTRLWMYASPVLYYPEAVKKLTSHDWLMSLNPLFDVINIWTGSIARLDTFSMTTWGVASAWAVFTFVCGVLVFLSREGEFAVRI